MDGPARRGGQRHCALTIRQVAFAVLSLSPSCCHRILKLSARSATMTSTGTTPMTAMTMTEKILARHAGRDAVAPGDNIWANVDILMTHDVCGPGTIGIFKQHF